MTHENICSERWWREFFESPDSIPLSFFPDDSETAEQVDGIISLLDLQPGEVVADVCCGMGRHAIPLARRGMDVFALDAADMMLQIADELSEGDETLHLVRGDAARLPFRDEAFGAMLNLFNSFGYFLDEQQDMAVLEETVRCLQPGGRFLLETRNRKYQILYAPYYQEVQRADGSEAVIRCRYDKDRQRLTSIWSDPDDPDTVLHEASIRLYGLDELLELFDRVGLEVDAVHGGYDGRDFEGWERMLILVAHKP